MSAAQLVMQMQKSAALVLQTPGLISSVSSTNSGTQALGAKVQTTCAANAYCGNLLTPSLTGALLVTAVTYNFTSAPTVTVTTDKSQTMTCLTAVNTGNFYLTICYLPNATAGTFAITATFNQAVTHTAIENYSFYNITDTTPVDVSSSAVIASSGTSVAAGSITPTQNNDLILQVACRTQTPIQTAAFTKGSGFTKLTDNAMVTGQATDSGGSNCMSQYQVQSSAGAINPTLTWTASGGLTYAVAFKASSAATTTPSGMYPVHMQSVTTVSPLVSPVNVAFPSTGNLITVQLACGLPQNSSWTGTDVGLTNMSDSSSNYWNISWMNSAFRDGNPNTGTQIAAAANATTSDTMTLSFTLLNENDCTFKIVDFTGAATDSIATRTTANCLSASPCNAASGTFTLLSATPGITSGYVVGVISLDANTCLSATSPSGTNFLADTTGGEPISGTWPIDQNNCYAIFPAASNASETWTWGLSQSTLATSMYSGEIWGFAASGATKSGQTVSYPAGLPCAGNVCNGVSSASTVQTWSGQATSQNFSSGTITVGGNKPVIAVAVGICIAGSGCSAATVSSVSWSLGSGTASQITTVATVDTRVSIWCIPAPVQGQGTVSIGLSASEPHQAVVAMFEHADQGAIGASTGPCPTGDAATASGVTNPLTVTPTNLVAADAVFGLGANAQAGDSPNWNQTQLLKNNTTLVNASGGYHLGTGAVSVTWGTPNAVDALAAVRIKGSQ